MERLVVDLFYQISFLNKFLVSIGTLGIKYKGKFFKPITSPDVFNS